MTLASEIISAAYRESNLLAIGVAPSVAEDGEGLTLLQSLLDTVFPLVVGSKLPSWYVPRPQKTSAAAANYPASPGDAGILPPNKVQNPPANVRLMMKNTSEEKIYFQYQPQDGALMEYVDIGHTADVILDSNAQLFGLTGGATTITLTSDFPTTRNATRRWVYRAEVGSWVEIGTLALVTELPFPEWFDDYFVTALAIRLAPRFGGDPRQATVIRNTEMKVFIRGQYEQMGISITGTPEGRRSLQSWDGDIEGFQSGDFLNGLVP